MFFKKAVSWIAKQIGGKDLQRRVSSWFDKTALGKALSIAGDTLLVGGAVKGVGALKGLMTGSKAAQAASAAKQTQAIIAAGPKPAQALITGSANVAPKALSQAATAASPSALSIGAGQAASSLPTAALTGGRYQAAEQMLQGAQQAGGAVAQQAAQLGTLPVPAAPISALAPRAATMVAPQVAEAVAKPSIGQMLGKGAKDLAGEALGAAKTGLGKAGQFTKENAAWLGPAAIATSSVLGQRAEMSLEEERMRREQEARNSLAGLLMGAFGPQMGAGGGTAGTGAGSPGSVTNRYAPDQLASLGRGVNALPGFPSYRG